MIIFLLLIMDIYNNIVQIINFHINKTRIIIKSYNAQLLDFHQEDGGLDAAVGMGKARISEAFPHRERKTQGLPQAPSH